MAAVYLNSRGFAFVLFESALAPVDWGAIEVRGKHRRDRLMHRISELLSRYTPHVLILQDTSQTGTRRTHRIRRLNEAVADAAEAQGVAVLSYSRDDVRRCFEHVGRVNKDTIAATIAKNLPAFERFLPPPRKPWMSEDARMGIFDAAALALTFFWMQDGF